MLSGSLQCHISPLLGLILVEAQVKSAETSRAMLGWGKMLSAVCEQWEGLLSPALSATNLVIAP